MFIIVVVFVEMEARQGREKKEQSLVQLDKHLFQQAVDFTSQLCGVVSDLFLSYHISHGLQLQLASTDPNKSSALKLLCKLYQC